MKRHAIVFWVAAALAVLGFFDRLLFDPMVLVRMLLIPVLVFGVVFLPSARTMEKVAAAKKTHTAGKRKHYPFQVIEGSKGKNDDQQPKYH